MNLAKMLFSNLDMEDFFGLKIIKNGFTANNDGALPPSGAGGSAPDSNYLEDVIVLESKQYNTSVKQKYLDDYTNELQAHNKGCNRMTTKLA